jgi:tetratricopeptide (TPR) repeat protein
MNGRCLTPEEIGDLLDGAGSAHVETCARCARIVMATRALETTPAVEEAVVALGARLDEARALVNALRGEMPIRWWKIAMNEPRFRDVSVISALVSDADSEAYRSPTKALELARIAVALSDSLPKGDVATERLRAAAWKETAIAYFLLSQIDAANNAITSAEAALSSTAGDDHDRAVVAYARAWMNAHADVARYDVAEAALAECEPIFASTDARRARACRHLAAFVLSRTNRAEAALAMLMDLASRATDGADERDAADLDRLIADCHLRLGNASQALMVASAVAERDAAADRAIGFAQATWIAGVAALRLGEVEAAIAHLEGAVATLSREGSEDAALRATIDLLHARKVLSPNESLLPAISNVVERSHALDAREPSRRRHFTAEAMDFLRAEAAAERLSASDLAYVADYLREIHEAAPVKFQPPLFAM